MILAPFTAPSHARCDPALEQIREANPLRFVLEADGHTPRGPAGGPWKLCCPFHAEKTASFTLYPEGRFKCFGCGITGDVFTYVSARDNVDFATAKRTLAVGASAPFSSQSGLIEKELKTARLTLTTEPPRRTLSLPPDAHRPTYKESVAIAHSRRVNPEAVDLAGAWGFLRVGTVCSYPSWIITDAARYVAEARRIDGNIFPRCGSLNERKAHALAGSVKSWPCGLMPHHGLPAGVRAILIVEGGPDYLAALHFCLEHGAWDLWPVAMLGGGIAKFHIEALGILLGRRVRLYPHADPTGASSVQRWATQLLEISCKVDGFKCEGIFRRDGGPCKDLNDLVLADDKARPTLSVLLP